jgi:cell division transport system permease protein
MRRQPLVFSFVKEQAIFLTALIALLSFLAILALGITIGIGAGVNSWNSKWNTFATIQVLPGGDFDAVQKLASTAKRANIIPEEEVSKMLRPWLGGGSTLQQYLPKMIEIEVARKSDLAAFEQQAASMPNVRFITHSDGAKNITNAGWQIMSISIIVMLMVLSAISLCISYITRNITLIHKRELEILTQIGASDLFVARQMQTIITKISALAAAIGLIFAVPMILLIISMAAGTRIGLMAQMHIPTAGWVTIALLPIGIIVLTAWLARKTTLKILSI